MPATTEPPAAAPNGNGIRKRALLNSACVVCGAANPNGLHLIFRRSPEGVTAEWSPRAGWESFQGVIHGGIISTVLDEAMSKAIIDRGHEALTAEITVRFRRQVRPGDVLRVRGWIVDERKRRIRAEATLESVGNGEYAHAWASFLILPDVV